MAKQTLNTIKNWFKTGLKPTQQQFWDTWDSFWHKDQVIPASSIENLDARFDEKADEEAFENHLSDLNAHNIGNLSIPAGPINTLTGSGTRANLFYNTIDQVLYIYDGVAWRPAVEADLTQFYTKAEIDSLFVGSAPALSASNGLTKTNDVIKLGGDLSEPMTIIGSMGTNSPSISIMDMGTYSATGVAVGFDNNRAGVSVQKGVNGANLAEFNLTAAEGGNISTSYLGIGGRTDGYFVVTDNIKSKGIRYNSDYSNNWDASDENILITKKYADNLASSMRNGYAKLNENNYYGGINSTSGYWETYDGDDGKGLRILEDSITYTHGDRYTQEIQFPPLTGNSVVKFQDKDGTIALLSDVSAAGSGYAKLSTRNDFYGEQYFNGTGIVAYILPGFFGTLNIKTSLTSNLNPDRLFFGDDLGNGTSYAFGKITYNKFTYTLPDIGGRLLVDQNLTDQLSTKQNVQKAINFTAFNRIIDMSKDIEMINANSGNIIVSLPDLAAGGLYQNREVTIKKYDPSGNTVTINAFPGNDIEGQSSKVLYSQWDYITLVSAGNSYWIITSYGISAQPL